MKLTLGFSPCPNDTYIFDALVNHKIDTEGLEFDYVMADVEELNRMAFNQSLQITKLSYHAFLYLSDSYSLLDSGSALGYGTGPLLIARKQLDLNELNSAPVAIPGKFTSASLLFSLAYPEVKQTKEMLFSEIEQAVLDHSVIAGVIIHENRFTFREKGLVQITDLGEYWCNRTKTPVPLGGIVANRKLDPDIVLKFNELLRKSIQYAAKNKELPSFVCCNAQEMQPEVMKQHIDLYVNDFTTQLGPAGREAVTRLFSEAYVIGLIPALPQRIFFDD